MTDRIDLGDWLNDGENKDTEIWEEELMNIRIFYATPIEQWEFATVRRGPNMVAPYFQGTCWGGDDGRSFVSASLPLYVMMGALSYNERRGFADKFNRYIKKMEQEYTTQMDGWRIFSDLIKYEGDTDGAD